MRKKVISYLIVIIVISLLGWPDIATPDEINRTRDEEYKKRKTELIESIGNLAKNIRFQKEDLEKSIRYRAGSAEFERKSWDDIIERWYISIDEAKDRLRKRERELDDLKEEVKTINNGTLPEWWFEDSKEQKKALMVLIPAGKFMVGEPNSLKGMLLHAFYIDKYEVTQREYEQVIGKNPSKFKNFKDANNNPVESVTWYEAEEYCRKVGKRLPTEWEWEKAAKAGTTTTYYWGNEVGVNNANCAARYPGTTPVGSFKPNTYGLYDMAGNVWEWTNSDYDGSGKYKTLRGGSWDYGDLDVRPSIRINSEPDNRTYSYGFRCAQ